MELLPFQRMPIILKIYSNKLMTVCTKEREQAFQGVVIKRRGGGAGESFTVRKISQGIGVERVFPLHSPNLKSITVVRRGKVRRAKLYYLRDRIGKAARIKEKRTRPQESGGKKK